MSDYVFRVNFHVRLKDCRTALHLTQATTAQQLDITLRSYQRYENGSREPDIDTLCEIADYFNVSIDFLLGRDDYTRTSEDRIFELQIIIKELQEDQQDRATRALIKIYSQELENLLKQQPADQ